MLSPENENNHGRGSDRSTSLSPVPPLPSLLSHVSSKNPEIRRVLTRSGNFSATRPRKFLEVTGGRKRGIWRPTRRNIAPIVDSLSVVHPAVVSTPPRLPLSPHLIYLLFLNTFVEQFVIARCRLATCAKADALARGREGEGWWW